MPSQNQAAKTSKEPEDRKAELDPRMKIRIRLPPRKRLTNYLNTNNNPSKKAPEHTDEQMPSKSLPNAGLQGEVSKNCPEKGLCHEAKSNSLSTILTAEGGTNISTNEQHEEVNGSTLSNNLTITTAGMQCNTNNSQIKKAPEHTDKQIPSKNLPNAGVQGEASKSCREKGMCHEANSNSLSITLPAEAGSNISTNKLHEEANQSILSNNLTITTAGMPTNDDSTYPAKEGLYEAANNATSGEPLPVPFEGLPAEPIDHIRSKDLSTTEAQVEENNYPRKTFLYNTTGNVPSKVVCKEADDNSPSRNLSNTAVKREKVLEQVHKHITTKKVSDKTERNAPSSRPTARASKNTSCKKPCTFAVPITNIIQNTSGMKLSSPYGQAVEQCSDATKFMAIKEYQQFEEMVKRTVYLDNISHQVTEPVIRTALNQFGTVRKVSFLVNYTIPYDIPQSALVEMETEKDALTVVNMLHEFLFMMAGMPRPVRAKHATAEMFNDRPRRPGSKLKFQWMGPTDPVCHICKKIKLMTRRHEMENLALIKHELEVEQSLAKEQEENLNHTYQKLLSLESVIVPGLLDKMLHNYGIKFNEVF